jgi:hypothetical protein
LSLALFLALSFAAAMWGFQGEANSSELFLRSRAQAQADQLRFVPEALHLLLSLAALAALLRLSPTQEQALVAGMQVLAARWQHWPQARRAAIGLGGVLFLTALMVWQVMTPAFQAGTYAYGGQEWDYQTQVFVPDKQDRLFLSLEGLAADCWLCTGERQALELYSLGDDLGVYWMFGAAQQAGLLPPTLGGYQQFLAALFALSLLGGGLWLAWAYGGWGPAVLWAWGVVLLWEAPHYPSLLLTTYWVSNWSALLSGTLLIGALMAFRQPEKFRAWHFGGLFLAWGLLAGLAYLGRSPEGYVTLFAALLALALAYGYRAGPRWFYALGLGVLLLGYLLPQWAFQATITYRDEKFQLAVDEGATQTSHGFSHALYLGLGYVPNRWEIYFNDQLGGQHVDVQCPGAAYLSDAYYACLQDRFLQIIREDPGLLARNLILKLEAILYSSLHFSPWPLYLPALLLWWRPRRAYLAWGLLIAFSLFPALLSVPYVAYMQNALTLLPLFAIQGVLDAVYPPHSADS